MKKDAEKTMEEEMNALRAGVLGSNDGILSVVGVLFSVAAATTDRFTILLAGLSALVACALSMAAGEYASVSVQRDTEKVAVAEERLRLQNDPSQEHTERVEYYVDKGVSHHTAVAIADELLASDRALAVMVNVRNGFELDQYLSPWAAAFSSLFSAALGGIFPLAAMLYAPANLRWQTTILAVVVSVALTGLISAKLGKANMFRAMLRNIVIGIITMAIHYYVGQLI